MTAYQTCTTIFADGDVEGRASGDNVHILCFGNVPGQDAVVLVGQVILTRHTILKMYNAITKGIDKSFAQPKAKVIKYQRPVVVEGA